MKNNNDDICKDIDEKKVAWKVLKIIGMVLLGIVVCVLLGFVVMWLWNWLMPMIFGLAKITYWQAVGIFILAKLIFGGIGAGSGGGSKKKEKGTVRQAIKDEIKKEFDKEFDKERAKNGESYETANKDYEAMYEKWWETEGEKHFDDYMEKNKE